MSADVSIVLIRKSDYAPYDEFWLGGNGVDQAARYTDAFDTGKRIDAASSEVIPLTPIEALNFLTMHEDDFYLGHAASSARQAIIKPNISEFAIFLVVS